MRTSSHASLNVLSIALGFVVACMTSVALPACKKPASDSSEGSSGGAGTTSTRSGDGKKARVVELVFAYGSEKKAWLEDAIATFNDSPEARTDSFTIRIKGVAQGSGTALTDIVEGVVKPHLWSPASDFYRALLTRAWTAKVGAAGSVADIASDSKPLVLSPVVIAMWKPMAEALGWPDKPIGWSDILALSADKQGWASRGHAEWGQFKLGHTHPEFSNSGLLSVLAEAYAAAGKTTGLAAEDLASAQTRKFLEEIEGSIIHYGKSTGFFADKMLQRGPSYLSAAVVYENLVIDSYKRPEYRDREMDLVAIYPKEGTFWIENPMVILDAPWVTEEHKKAGAAFRDYLLGKPMQTRAMTEYGFRPSDPAIAIAAPLDAEHGVDPKQPTTLLDVPDSNVLDGALETWKQVKKTVDLVFVFDRSGSMSGAPLRNAKQGALDFMSLLDPRDRVAIVMFNHKVESPIRDPVPVGANRAALQKKIDSTFADGGTALYDAIAAAHGKLKGAAARDAKRIFALVVMTDGLDESSSMKYEALTRAIAPPAEQAIAVKLFTIAYGNAADKNALAAIAEAGGGASFTGDLGSIRQIYRDLAAFF